MREGPGLWIAFAALTLMLIGLWLPEGRSSTAIHVVSIVLFLVSLYLFGQERARSVRAGREG